MQRRILPYLLFLLVIKLCLSAPALAEQEAKASYVVRPGDTWTALAFNLNSSPTKIMETVGMINPQRQPVIGSSIWLHEVTTRNGKLMRPVSGGLLELSLRSGRSLWLISLDNEIRHPYSPLVYTPIFLPGGTQPPRELPSGFLTLGISELRATSGQALVLQGISPLDSGIQISLANDPWIVNRNEERLLAFGATDAFFGAGTPELHIQVEGYPSWHQPWLFDENDWDYEQISFAATPATEKETMLQERERLRHIWQQVTPTPLWTSTFKRPLRDYIDLTSPYGARRSINDGPYETYHEGNDFSAYRGTPVYASSNGKVALAEELIVRGGTVILDHGLGIHTGYYHLSEISVKAGDIVNAGDILGKVGSTGRSTGNHLHWDLLIGTTWVDAEAWIESNLAARALVGWGDPLPQASLRDIPSKP